MKKALFLLGTICIALLSRSQGNITVVMQPNALEGKDATAWLLYPNSNFGDDQQANILAWTNQGAATHMRYYVDFNFDTIPASSTIQTALLYLYNYPTAPTCNGSHLQLSGSNEMAIRRVTSNWSEYTLSWNNQPTVTDSNMVVTPPSTSTHQNYVIDVTSLVQDIVDNPSSSYGFGMKLITETIYRSLIFASSDNTNSLLHPKIEITYAAPFHGITYYIDTCDYYIWPLNGQTYTQSGIYYDTIQSSIGQDSIFALDLTISQDSYTNVEVEVCDSLYYWEALGDTLFEEGEYATKVITSAGCDSTILISLTFTDPYADTLIVSSCSPYFWSETGQTYTISGLYQVSYNSLSGCDSTILLDFTILEEFEHHETVESCEQYYWNIPGQYLSTTGTFVAQYTSTSGCDSTYMLDLTILDSFNETIEISACDQYYWDKTGLTYILSGVYEFNGTSSAGCDSSYILNLEIDKLSITLNPIDRLAYEGEDATFTILANPFSSFYQWQKNDGTGFINLLNTALITGSTTNELTLNDIPIGWNSYTFRCVVNNGSCSDTTSIATLHVSNLGMECILSSKIKLYPNPARDYLYVDSPENVEITIFDILGKEIESINTSEKKYFDVSQISNAIYLIQMKDLENGQMHYQLFEVKKD